MIEFIQGLFGRRLHLPEIHENPVFLQRTSAYDYVNPPVMSVKIFTLSLKVPQIMSSSKAADDLYFKYSLLQTTPP